MCGCDSVKLLMHGECVGANVKTQSDKRKMKGVWLAAQMCVRVLMCERLGFFFFVLTVPLAVVLFFRVCVCMFNLETS